MEISEIRKYVLVLFIVIVGLTTLYFLFIHKEKKTTEKIEDKKPTETSKLLEKIKLHYESENKIQHDLIWTPDDIVKPHQLKDNQLTFSGSDWQMAFSNRSHNSGKYYFELIPNIHQRLRIAENTYIGISTKGGQPKTKHGENNVSSWGISTDQISKFYNQQHINKHSNRLLFSLSNYIKKEEDNMRFPILGVINNTCNVVGLGFIYVDDKLIVDLLGNITDIDTIYKNFEENNKHFFGKNDVFDVYTIYDEEYYNQINLCDYLFEKKLGFSLTATNTANLLQKGFPIRIGVDIDRGKIHIFDYDNIILYTDDIDKNQEYFITTSMLSYLNDMTLVQPEFMTIPPGYKPW